MPAGGVRCARKSNWQCLVRRLFDLPCACVAYSFRERCTSSVCGYLLEITVSNGRGFKLSVTSSILLDWTLMCFGEIQMINFASYFLQRSVKFPCFIDIVYHFFTIDILYSAIKIVRHLYIWNAYLVCQVYYSVSYFNFHIL